MRQPEQQPEHPSAGRSAAAPARPRGFRVLARAPGAAARAGVLTTPHGEVATPALLPLVMSAPAEGLTPDELAELGAAALLVETHPLRLRGGLELAGRLGGLHRLVGWSGPLLADGGSLGAFGWRAAEPAAEGRARAPRPAPSPRTPRVDDDGVAFASPVDGATHRLTPETVVESLERLGADAGVLLYQPVPPEAPEPPARQAAERGRRWAERGLAARRRADLALFAAIADGSEPARCEASARLVASLPVDGFAWPAPAGGAAWRTLAWARPALPDDRPRLLTDVAGPADLLASIAAGADLLASDAPARLARRGLLYTSGTSEDTPSDTANDTTSGLQDVRDDAWRADARAPDPACDCDTCRRFSRAYLRHLFLAEELLGYRLAAIHNLRFVLALVAGVRQALLDGTYVGGERTGRTG